jgi:hypothetical protein
MPVASINLLILVGIWTSPDFAASTSNGLWLARKFLQNHAKLMPYE